MMNNEIHMIIYLIHLIIILKGICSGISMMFSPDCAQQMKLEKDV